MTNDLVWVLILYDQDNAPMGVHTAATEEQASIMSDTILEAFDGEVYCVHTIPTKMGLIFDEATLH